MNSIIVISLCFVIAGYFKALADNEVASNRVAKTWLNKWQLQKGQPIPSTKAPAYYFGLYKPKYVEAFAYSSTLLVSFTDNWHLYNGCLLYALSVAAAYQFSNVFLMVLIYAFALKTILSLTFQIFFKR